MKPTERYKMNIEYLIKKFGSQEKFADAIFVHKSEISREKNPELVKHTFLSKIHQVLGYDFDDVMHGYLESIDNEVPRNQYAYFFSTLSQDSVLMDTAHIKIDKNKFDFIIQLTNIDPKKLNGKVVFHKKIVYFAMRGEYEGNPYQAYITLPYFKPYIGGLGYIMLPSEALSLPCVHKVILSNVKLDLSNKEAKDYEFLLRVLKLNANNEYFQKGSRKEAAEVHKYLSELCNQ